MSCPSSTLCTAATTASPTSLLQHSTLESVESLLAAFYQSGWLLGGRYQPVPIRSVPVNEDFLLLGYNPLLCPLYGEKADEYMAGPVWQAKAKEEAPLMREVEAAMGLPKGSMTIDLVRRSVACPC